MNSVVLKWPDRHTVHRAAKAWAEQTGKASRAVLRIGYFGSYATGKWGVGSDLDILILVESADLPFETRAMRFLVSGIPVHCQVLVYTTDEWKRMLQEGRLFPKTVEAEMVCLYER